MKTQTMSGVVDRAVGITPTADLWGTPPPNLEIITDGDLNTYTQGQTTTVGAGNVGRLTLDLGDVYPIDPVFRLEMWSTGGTVMRAWSEYSVDGLTWYELSGIYISSASVAAPERRVGMDEHADTRHYRLTWYGFGADTFYVRIYGLECLELMRRGLIQI